MKRLDLGFYVGGFMGLEALGFRLDNSTSTPRPKPPRTSTAGFKTHWNPGILSKKKE